MPRQHLLSLALILTACPAGGDPVDTDSDTPTDTGGDTGTGSDTGGDTSDGGDSGDSGGDTGGDTSDGGDSGDSGGDTGGDTSDSGDSGDSGGDTGGDTSDTGGLVGTPEDLDGDGILNEVDCAPDDPAVYGPGTAYWMPGSGPGVNVTSSVSGGSPAAPVVFTPTSSGELRLCGGTYHVEIRADGVDVDVLGLGGRDAVTVDVFGGGSALRALTGGSIHGVGLTLRGGKRNTYGGALYVQNGSSGALTDSRVADTIGFAASNHVANAAVFSSDDAVALDLTRVVFENNESVLRVSGTCTATFTDVVIDGTLDGLGEVRGMLTGTGLKVRNAGGTYLQIEGGATLDVEQVQVEDASLGVVFFTPSYNAARVRIHDAVFEDLTGNAFRLGGQTVTLSDVTVRRTTAQSAPEIGGASDVTVTDAVFEDNTVTVSFAQGGALRVTVSDRFTCTRCTFARNTGALDGGAVFMGATGTVGFVDSVFTDNVASRHGGAIHGVSGGFSVSGSSFTGNEAKQGGAAYLGPSSGTARDHTFTNTTFTGNAATEGEGGAIFGDWMNLIVSDSTFSGNTATVAGGAVRTRRQSTFTDTDFLDNTAGNGAAYQSTDILGATFTRGAFLRNVAAASDGAALRYLVLTATDVDFGTGPDDNAPHDLSDGGVNQYDFSGVASVNCNGTCTTP